MISTAAYASQHIKNPPGFFLLCKHFHHIQITSLNAPRATGSQRIKISAVAVGHDIVPVPALCTASAFAIPSCQVLHLRWIDRDHFIQAIIWCLVSVIADIINVSAPLSIFFEFPFSLWILSRQLICMQGYGSTHKEWEVPKGIPWCNNNPCRSRRLLFLCSHILLRTFLAEQFIQCKKIHIRVSRLTRNKRTIRKL